MNTIYGYVTKVLEIRKSKNELYWVVDVEMDMYGSIKKTTIPVGSKEQAKSIKVGDKFLV